MSNPPPDRVADPGGWAMPGSILAGSLIAGVFEPWLLIAGAGALIWLGLIHRSFSRRLRSLDEHGRVLESRAHKAQLFRARLR